MGESQYGFEVKAETTEQALARVEAECGWSDLSRFADAFAVQLSAPAGSGEPHGQ